ncbi:MAG: alkaline phosphatase [Burkholderiales bacterium]
MRPSRLFRSGHGRKSLSSAGLAVAIAVSAAPATAAEPTPEEWYAAGARAVAANQRIRNVGGNARNVILFIGDGMGLSTITAARILDGQRKGMSGEENSLSFERFPNLALIKTYSANQQVADSAPTMSAIMTGVKTNDGVISVNHLVDRREKNRFKVKAAARRTLLEWAESRGLSTGVVSSARVTHATPAACYAHITERDWEGDGDLPADATVPDIAHQLIDFEYGNGLEVVLGGGRAKFLPRQSTDPEYPNAKGSRRDGKDLTAEWLRKFDRPAYVWNRAQFDAIDPEQVDHLLGLFEPGHMKYEADRARDPAGEPDLTAMTVKAIQILARNPKGYFLMVEGGRIDHGHHASNAYRALTDAIALSEAVARARAMTSPADTLILVTADHSHVFTMGGYAKRGNPILGKVIEPGRDDFAHDAMGLPYTTLGYMNGPGHHGTSNVQRAGPKWFEHSPNHYDADATRADLTQVDTEAPNYLQESAIPLGSETHGGEDVAAFADGPGAHLVRGVMEQNALFHVMREAFGWR